jgi:hypothetical protein
VFDAADGHHFMIRRILKFLRCHVYTWETLYLHYFRKTLRHFDTSHSSAHEGTNNGMKSHSAGVQAMMGVDTSAKAMNTQTNITVAESEELIFHEATCTHKKWSNLPTAPYVVTVAEGLLNKMMSRKKLYHAKLIARMVNCHVCTN